MMQDKLCKATKEELAAILADETNAAMLIEAARETAQSVFGKGIFVRGLIEISSFCKNNCYYCGIRAGNACAARYRLQPDEILEAAAYGYEHGIRTFVLQGGEDPYFTDQRLVEIVRSLKKAYPDTAVTLSMGERSHASYAALRDAGADRYLLRHEAASESLYQKLHPPAMLLKTRKACLADLKELGFQTGAGFMVGAPYQTMEDIAEDLLFLKKLAPHMIGVGPFVPHQDTPFKNAPQGSTKLTVKILAILRLMHKHALLPATTALATIDSRGREKGILAGANVVMPNLTPPRVRGMYALYNNKAFEELRTLKNNIEKIGYHIVISRGDYPCTM